MYFYISSWITANFDKMRNPREKFLCKASKPLTLSTVPISLVASSEMSIEWTETSCEEFHIQLFKKKLSKEKQTSHKPRARGSMGSFKSVFIAAVKDKRLSSVYEKKRTHTNPVSSRNTNISGSKVQTFERKFTLICSDL